MDTIITTRYCVLLRLMSIEFCVPVAFLTTPPGSKVMIDSGFQTTEDATQEFRPNL